MVTRRFMVSASALVAVAACTRALEAVAGAEADAGTFPLRRSEAEWRRILPPDRYAVLRRGQAEPAFSSPLRAERRRGAFACEGCGQDAFSSAAKLDDGAGWPGFWAAYYGAVAEVEDRFAAASRTVVRCSRCGGHLGTLSRRAPTPTGLHHRVDGLALTFAPAEPQGAASS